MADQAAKAATDGEGAPSALARLLGWLFGRQTAPVREPGLGPKRVLILRHAEKTGAEDDIHLSKPGYMRAKKLASYIPKTFGTPDYIFAAARSKRSIRSIETVSPLALSLNKSVQHSIEDKDFAALVRQLYSDPIYAGATVVVCWHHNKLPEIARMLGAPDASYPDPWPSDLYDAIIDISYGADGTVTARDVKQPF